MARKVLIEATYLITVLVYQSFVYANIDPSNVKVLPVREQVLWENGEGNVNEYRIPVITSTVSGYLIAAVEARKYGPGDASNKFLAVRRSKDGGRNWEPQQFILNDGAHVKDGMNLGAILTDRETGVVFISFCTCGHDTDKNCTKSTHMINSTDEGNTWNHPVNMSAQLGNVAFAAGPGYGIQKQHAPHKGRLIICGHVRLSGSQCILSDNHGLSWRFHKQGLYSLPYNQTQKVGDFSPNECQIVELPDGSIMLNARNQYRYRCSCRVVAMSYDGGETFPTPYISFDEALIEPACAAGLLYHQGIMFFTNPKNAKSREDLVLQWSFSNGTKWEHEYKLWPKLVSYSTLTAIPGHIAYDPFIYILYEKGSIKLVETISLIIVSLDGSIL